MQQQPPNVRQIRILKTYDGMDLPRQQFKPYIYEWTDGIFTYSKYVTPAGETYVNGPEGTSEILLPLPTANAPIQLSTIDFPPNHRYHLEGEFVYQDGNKSERFPINAIYEDGYWFGLYPFIDGSAQIRENLKFKLRAASLNNRFNVAIEGASSGDDTDMWLFEEEPADYVSSGFISDHNLRQDSTDLWDWDHPDPQYEHFDPFLPIQHNFLIQNWKYNSSLLSAAQSECTGDTIFDTGLDGLSPMIGRQDLLAFSLSNARFDFDVPTYAQTQPPPPLPLITTSASDLLCYGNCWWNFDLPVDENNYVTPGAQNYYGLPFTSVAMVFSRTGISSAPPGGYLSIPENAVDDIWFYSVADPSLSIPSASGYYFARFGDPRPGATGTDFTSSTASKLLVVPFGAPALLQAWAKMQINNGDPNKFAYAQQYFDKAFTSYPESAGGGATSTQTGILSEYGDFLATEAGKSWVTTKPDIATGQVGSYPVYALKLQLDVNHDGNMDLTCTGPDNTSPENPFVFWINDDNDRYALDKWEAQYMDQDVESSSANYSYPYRNQIECARDLEDFARLWFVGVPPLDSSYTVTLAWRNVSGDPEINLFKHITGTTDYLNDPSIAAGIAAGSSANYTGTVTPASAITFPGGYFTAGGNQYFLFEGAGVGSGELVLTITQNGQQVAETSTFIKLVQVKALFEEGMAQGVPSELPFYNQQPNTVPSTFRVLQNLAADPNEDKNLIVFVHGNNNTDFDYQSTSETMFKRLYWAGYHGHFASFRWPCKYLPPNTVNPFDFNVGEFVAWKSAPGLKGYLNYLKTTPRLAGYKINILAHSQGNIVTSEAIKLGASFDNYILSQAAVPAHSYDPNVAPIPALRDAFPPAPFTAGEGGYDNYFSPITGNLINYFNPIDYALKTGTLLGGALIVNWEQDQLTAKPEHFAITGPIYSFAPSNPAGTGVSTAKYYSSDGSVLLSSRVVTDFYETKGVVARSHTSAVGAQPDVHGKIQGQVDLQATFNFGRTRSEHSAEFSRGIQTSRSYFQQVLRSYQITPAP